MERLAMLSHMMPPRKGPLSHIAQPDMQTNTGQNRCYLLELPPEIRLIIYAYAFPTRTIHLWLDWNVYRWRSYTPNSSVSLLKTCRMMYSEASPIFHDQTTVHFSICDEFERPLSRYHRFSPLEKLDASSFSLVSKLSFSLHTLTEPIFKDLLAHANTLLDRLDFCANARGIEIHFEFWSTISDEDLYWIYDELCNIRYGREMEIGTSITGCWIILYEGECFKTCISKIRDDVLARRQGWPVSMMSEDIGSLVGPRDLIIRSKRCDRGSSRSGSLS